MPNIVIIPARGGSKRLPNKNVLNLGSKPLIAHSIEYALANPSFVDDVYVSTDSEAIKSIALQYGAKVIDRPSEFAQDYTPTIDVLKHAIEDLNIENGHIILLQPTNPLRPKKLLSEAMDIIVERKYNSLFTVSRSYKKLGKINSNKFVPFNYKIGQRSQDLEPLYFENGLLYISGIDQIQKGVIFDQSSYPFVVDHIFANIDIDTIDDLQLAEWTLKHSSNI